MIMDTTTCPACCCQYWAYLNCTVLCGLTCKLVLLQVVARGAGKDLLPGPLLSELLCASGADKPVDRATGTADKYTVFEELVRAHLVRKLQEEVGVAERSLGIVHGGCFPAQSLDISPGSYNTGLNGGYAVLVGEINPNC